MEEWIAEFLYELLLIIGAIFIGVGFGSPEPTNGLIPVLGIFFVLISVFIKLRYPK